MKEHGDLSPEGEERAKRRESRLTRFAGLSFVTAVAMSALDIVTGGDVPNWLWILAYSGGVLLGAGAGWVETEQLRPYEMARKASAMGLTFASPDSSALADIPRSLIPAPPGRTAERVGNVMRGTWQGLDVRVFDSTAREEHSRWDDEPSQVRYLCAAARLDAALPPTVIETRRGLGRRWRPIKDPGVHLRDPSFEERFVVHTTDDRFAQRLLDPSLQAWFLQLEPGCGARMEQGWVALYRRSLHSSVQEAEPLLRDLHALVGRLPPWISTSPSTS